MKVTMGNKGTNDEDNALKPLIDALRKDGLIDGKNYTIELENGILKINGTEQTKEALDKYLPLLKVDKINIKVTEN